MLAWCPTPRTIVTTDPANQPCPWPKLDLKGVDHTTGSLQTAADKESQKSAGLRDERSVNGSPV